MSKEPNLLSTEIIIANRVYRVISTRENWQICLLCDGEGCIECNGTGYIEWEDLKEFGEWCERGTAQE